MVNTVERTVEGAFFDPIVYEVEVCMIDPQQNEKITVYDRPPVVRRTEEDHVLTDILGVTRVLSARLVIGVVWTPVRWKLTRLEITTGVKVKNVVPACLTVDHGEPIQVAELEDDVWACPVCAAAARGIHIV